MRANIENARRGALDLLGCIKELQTLIPKIIAQNEALEARVKSLEEQISFVVECHDSGKIS